MPDPERIWKMIQAGVAHPEQTILERLQHQGEDQMIAVIFEVMPAPGREQEYLDMAATLRPELDRIDGFISIERFSSLTHAGKILSLSLWRDEEAVAQWRQVEAHRLAQSRGRHGVFADYRLRVAGVIRDYGMLARHQAPPDSQAVHDGKR